jgi:acetyltransferase
MSHLIDHARATGIGRLFGSVLAENTTMLEMCKALGFGVGIDAADPAICEVTLSLTAD